MNSISTVLCFREELESNLTFVGLVVFENRVKSTSKQVIETLQLALIRTLMITGQLLIFLFQFKILKNMKIKISVKAWPMAHDSKFYCLIYYTTSSKSEMIHSYHFLFNFLLFYQFIFEVV